MNRILQKYRKGQPSIGTFTHMQSAALIEGLGYTGLDYVIIDTEHSPTDISFMSRAITAVPEYDTLLQNGWQRTEDFFGCREIFFSGKFDDAEPVIVDGGYEFSYRAASDASVLLRIIGEEKREIDTFLEKLRQRLQGVLCNVFESYRCSVFPVLLR